MLWRRGARVRRPSEFPYSRIQFTAFEDRGGPTLPPRAEGGNHDKRDIDSASSAPLSQGAIPALGDRTPIPTDHGASNRIFPTLPPG